MPYVWETGKTRKKGLRRWSKKIYTSVPGPQHTAGGSQVNHFVTYRTKTDKNTHLLTLTSISGLFLDSSEPVDIILAIIYFIICVFILPYCK